jgi:hypothetical protein
MGSLRPDMKEMELPEECIYLACFSLKRAHITGFACFLTKKLCMSLSAWGL